MIHIRELYFRVTSRSEFLPGDLRSALIEAGIAVCRQSNLLKEEVFATLPAGATRLLIPTPPDQDLVRVDQVFFRDPLHPDQEWTEVREIAPVYRERQRIHIESQDPGQPQDWSLRGTFLTFQGPSDAAYPLRIKFTWAPTRASQPETFDLPPEAEEAMVSYARYILFQDVDPKTSELAKRSFVNGLGDLRGQGDSGESGNRSIYDFLPEG